MQPYEREEMTDHGKEESEEGEGEETSGSEGKARSRQEGREEKSQEGEQGEGRNEGEEGEEGGGEEVAREIRPSEISQACGAREATLCSEESDGAAEACGSRGTARRAGAGSHAEQRFRTRAAVDQLGSVRLRRIGESASRASTGEGCAPRWRR
jgi:hypothetical protein